MNLRDNGEVVLTVLGLEALLSFQIVSFSHGSVLPNKAHSFCYSIFEVDRWLLAIFDT